MSEFDIKKCVEITGEAVILTNNNKAYFILNGKIVMRNNKPQHVRESTGKSSRQVSL